MTAVEIETRFNRLQLRERILLLMAVLAVLLFVFTQLFFRPLRQQQLVEQQQQIDVKTQRDQLLSELATLQARATATQSAPDLKDLQKELSEVDEAIAQKTQNMVPPGEMYDVLRQVLQQQKGIELVSLQHNDVTQAVANSESSYYRHPLRIIVRGNYFDVLNYLRDLEQLRWRFQWEGLRYEVHDYPIALVSFDVSSLSRQQEWLP